MDEIPEQEGFQVPGLFEITAMGPATGSFDLTFVGSDHLSGRFNAVFCPGGVEP